MYKTGDLMVTTPKCETWNDEYSLCDDEYAEGHEHCIYDTRSGHEYCEAGIVFMPHSCDEWVIGGAEEIRQLICDLQKIERNLMITEEEKSWM